MMHVKILLPYKMFLELKDVKHIIAEGPQGHFGVLPRRLDCVSPLVAGLMTIESESQGLLHLAIDEGIFTKVGEEVYVSVRDAVFGGDLEKLKMALEEKFAKRKETEAHLQKTLIKLEAQFKRRLWEIKNEI